MKAARQITTLAAALASVALITSGAQAAERPDDRGGMIGVGSTQGVAVAPDAFERAVGRSTVGVPVPDAFERAAARALAGDVNVRPDDRASARGPGALTPTAVSTSTGSLDESFASDEAALGAVAGFGLLVLGTLALLTFRRRRMILR